MNRNTHAKIQVNRDTFKAALAQSMRGSDVPLKVLIDAMGVSNALGYAYADPDSPEVPSMARLELLLPHLTDPTVIDHLASRMGRRTFAVIAPTDAPVAVSQLAELAGAFAALLTHHAVASRDGRWTEKEVAELRPIATELAARAMAQLAYAERQVGPVVELASSRRTA